MAVVAVVDVEVLSVKSQDEINAGNAAAILALQTELAAIKADYVTSTNVNQKLREQAPVFHGNPSENNKPDYNSLTWGDHLIWDFATGETHAPPVPVAQWTYVEMIKTFQAGSGESHSAMQRAWGYKNGFLAIRNRYGGVWSAWVVMAVQEPPVGMPPEPDMV